MGLCAQAAAAASCVGRRSYYADEATVSQRCPQWNSNGLRTRMGDGEAVRVSLTAECERSRGSPARVGVGARPPLRGPTRRPDNPTPTNAQRVCG